MPPLNDGQDIAISNAEKAEALAKNYEKVHKLTSNYGDPVANELTQKLAEIIKNEEHDPDNIGLTSPAALKGIIKRFKNGKVPGEDNISNIALNNLNNKPLIQLTHIMNSCMK